MIKNSLESIKLVDRVTYLRHLCQGKRVLHLGATGSPETREAVSRGRLLHNHLSEVAEYIVGMDISIEMIKWLSENCQINNIKYGNIENTEDYPKEDFDIIVAGEILEHLSNPGNAIDSIRAVVKPFTKLLITVPNAYSFKGFSRALLKHELIHPNHTLHHSPHTLKALLERHGFSGDTYFSFVNGGTGMLASTTNFFLRFNPQLAEGIGVICSPK